MRKEAKCGGACGVRKSVRVKFGLVGENLGGGLVCGCLMGFFGGGRAERKVGSWGDLGGGSGNIEKD